VSRDALSVCTGVGGIDLGLERAGWRIVAQCEKDAYRRRVLARHWPGVPCFEDIREVSRSQLDGRRRQLEREQRGADGGDRPERRARWRGVDLLAGGTPCQDLSVAGRRAGLVNGERSSLFFEFARIADELVRPGGWLLFENVPGLLSSHEGRDFALVLSTLADIGFHDLAWRVLDSRYFGVPQRRRRVFIVARRAAGRSACEVLLEPESGGGDFAPGREAGPRVAASLTSGSHGAGVNEPGRRKEDDINIVSALQRGSSGAGGHRIGAEEAAGGHLVGFDASEDGTGRGTPLTIAGPLGGGNDGAGRRTADDPNLVCAPAHPDRVRAPSGLPRRVDDPPPDGPRYSACGDAVTVNVAQWIGERILEHA